MVTQYPHSITLVSEGESTRDSNGDWQSVASSTRMLSGRFETARANAFITGADGEQIAYSGIVYLPFPIDPIALGIKVRVEDGALMVAEGTVKQFLSGQLNARLWL